MSPSPPTLSYATAGAASRVQYSRDGAVAKVVIPAPSGRRVGAAIDATAAVIAGVLFNELGVFVAALAVCGWLAGGYSRQLGLAVVVLSAIVGGVFVGAWLYYRRLDAPMTVEVTPDALSFLNLSAARKEHVLPRNLVYDIKFVTHSGNLVVRTRGWEIFEWRPVNSDAEILRLVTFLREVVGLEPNGDSAGQ
jgi:hypothetical protein